MLSIASLGLLATTSRTLSPRPLDMKRTVIASIAILTVVVSSVQGCTCTDGEVARLRPLGCNTKIGVTGVTRASGSTSGNLARLHDGIANDPAKRVDINTFPTSLDFALEPAPYFSAQANSQFVCAVGYSTDWWDKAPSTGEILFSKDGGASFSSEANFTGTYSGVYGPTFTPSKFNTFTTSGLANKIRITFNSVIGSGQPILMKEVDFFTWDN